MKYEHGYTVCISTQVGCRMGCSFCASGIDGLFRNLTASEMLAQVEMAGKDNGVRISNVVMMGMGEPFDNYDNVLKFLKMITDENGVNISMRHISVSTCGIIPGIKKLEQENLQLTLSVSLHAPPCRSPTYGISSGFLLLFLPGEPLLRSHLHAEPSIRPSQLSPGNR